MKPGIIAIVLLISLPSLSEKGFAQQNAAKPAVVCIDPGHPSEVNSGLTVQNGTTETHIDWVVAQKLRQLLVARGVTVVLTKSSEKQLVKNRERALIANRAQADLMVRLHCDSSPDQGYAVYYPDRQGTAQGKTGPSQVVMDRSRDAAKVMDRAMGRALNGVLKNGGVRGDSQTFIGSKQGALTGSIFSQVPVLTIEMVVLSHKADAALIQTEAGQNSMVQALADGIVQYVLPSQEGASRRRDHRRLTAPNTVPRVGTSLSVKQGPPIPYRNGRTCSLVR
jgi:N-acetylmuramoyl-L-alanine amidase